MSRFVSCNSIAATWQIGAIVSPHWRYGMMRMTGRALFASALMMAAGANAQAATQAECWKAIEQLKQHGVAVDQAIARQKANRTEASRCEMLAVTRKQVLQKIETSRVCGEFAPQNVAADIARAKAELDTLNSPDLKCNAAKSKSDSETGGAEMQPGWRRYDGRGSRVGSGSRPHECRQNPDLRFR